MDINADNQKIKHKLLTDWFPLKEEKHNIILEKIPKVANGEVWWVAVGENIGVEIILG